MNPILALMQVSNLMKGKNPEAVYNQLMQSNPQFKQFVEANKGKSAEQIAKENGIDPNLLSQFMK